MKENKENKKRIKERIAFIIGVIMIIVGFVLNIIAQIKEFGILRILSRPSIAETQLLFANQAEYIITGFILLILGGIIVNIVLRK